MNIRQFTEQREKQILSLQAAQSAAACRRHPEQPCPIRTAFQRDRDRVIHSKSFRRLKHKTQVYIAPVGDHFRTRMTHSLEVSQISRTIARGLNLNEDLVEAIALAHDVGHTPVGDVRQETRRKIIGSFSHNQQSLRVVDHLEREGIGLNLTEETRDGVLNHTGSDKPRTLEGQVVKIGDRIAYLCHDYDDSIRAGVLKTAVLPPEVIAVLGSGVSAMITAMVTDMITASQGQSEIRLSPPVEQAMNTFRQLMFQEVYHSKTLEAERTKGEYLITALYDYFVKYPEKLPTGFLRREQSIGLQQTIVDYIAGLTDNYAINLFESIFVPIQRWFNY